MKARVDLKETNQIFLQHLHEWSTHPHPKDFHYMDQLIERHYGSKTEYASQIASELAENDALQLYVQTFMEKHDEANLADSLKKIFRKPLLLRLFKNKNFQDCYLSQLINDDQLNLARPDMEYADVISTFENESSVNKIKTKALSFKDAFKNTVDTRLHNSQLRYEESKKIEAETRKKEMEAKAEQNKLAITHRDKGNTYYLNGNYSMAFKEHLLAWNLYKGLRATQYISGIFGVSSKERNIVSLMKQILDEKMNKEEIYHFIMTFSDSEQMVLFEACLNKSTMLGNKFAQPTAFYDYNAPNDDEIMLRVKNRLSLLSEKMELGTFMLQKMSGLVPEVSAIISCYFLQLSGIRLPVVKEQLHGGFFTKTMQLSKPELEVPINNPKPY